MIRYVTIQIPGVQGPPGDSEEYGGVNVSDAILRMWTQTGAWRIGAPDRDADGVIVTANIVWPDNSGGTFTRTHKNTTWLAVDGFTATHNLSGKTVTQPQLTRDSNGAVTTQPALIIGG